jgi:hypothetical protein
LGGADRRLPAHCVLRERAGGGTRGASLCGWVRELRPPGLTVVGREDIRPRHPKSSDETDPLHAARVAEVTSLWRLKAR